MLADNEETYEHFCVHGWMRVRAAFSVDEAAAMRAAAWRALAKLGIRRSDPSTWTTERPDPRQDIRNVTRIFRTMKGGVLYEPVDPARPLP